MKKFLILSIIFCCGLSLTSCKGSEKKSDSSTKDSTSTSNITSSTSTTTASSAQTSSTTQTSATVDSALPVKEYSTVDAEAALNAGQDLTGSIVSITVDQFEPASAFGYNIMTGEHLNFVSTDNPHVTVGESLRVKIVKISSMMGSFIITYEKQ